MDNPEVAMRKASHKSPILSLVDREHIKSVANIPRGAWEPIAYLYSEADKSVNRVKAMTVPGCEGVPDACKPVEHDDGTITYTEGRHDDACLEWVRQSCLKDWTQVVGWLDEILVDSQSIEALRSWQLMTGLQPQGLGGQRPSSAVMPDFPQPVAPGAEPKRRGMMRGT